MNQTVSALDRFEEPLRGHLRAYKALLADLFGAQIKSLALFGAAAAGSYDPRRHSVRNVLVVQAVDLSALRRLAERGVKLGKANIAAPLIMTPEYIQHSLDTFPLELIEIHQKHVVLAGSDLFADLQFKSDDVRYQCERELKVICIALRQGMLAAAGREKPMTKLVVSMGEDLLRVMRGMLWLKDRKDAQPGSQVILELENLTGRKLPGVRAAIADQIDQTWSRFEALYNEVESLGTLVDGW